MRLAALIGVVLLLLAFLAVWPPERAPGVWRRWTRPIRRRVRRSHYRHYL